MLTERLLQFIWQFQYFNTTSLFTTAGEVLQVLQAGAFNTNQGPDFSGAKVKIGDTIWAGNIELHILASDWLKHQHQTDERYQNVILHVVWENDKDITDRNRNIIPTLVLAPLVSKLMLTHYEKLMHSEGFVPCQAYLPVLSKLGWENWLERMLVERLQKRSALIFQKLEQNQNHWESVFWQVLARNFGVPVNSDAFESIAQSIPVSILAKQKNSVQQLEALFLGQSGLLEKENKDPYVLLLQREYSFVKNKYGLNTAAVKPIFLRMRPANFPTVRLAQLAMLIHQSEHLFSKMLEAKNSDEMIRSLNVTANDFWHYHYQLEQATDYKPKVLGDQMVENIVINTVVPVIFAYGLYHNNQVYKDKALEWLMQLQAEKNRVIRSWNSFGVLSENALLTQGLLELKKHYCDMRKCLDCAVGNKVLKG